MLPLARLGGGVCLGLLGCSALPYPWGFTLAYLAYPPRTALRHPLNTPMSQVLAKLEASIEAQQKKLAQLKAHKQKIETRQKSKLQGAARQQDTRRKVLAGAMLLELMNKDAELQKSMLGQLSSFLTRDDDRKLFGLTVSPNSEQSIG